MSEFNDIGSLASIIGAFLGIGAIAYAYCIKREVHNISNKQIENAQGPYKSNTETNMNEIHGHFRDLIRITKDYDKDSETSANMTSQIESYCDTNNSKMKSLLNKSKRNLELWLDLDKDKRKNYQSIIDDYEWLIHKFFQPNHDEEMQTRIWTDNHHELLQKKFKIEGILD